MGRIEHVDNEKQVVRIKSRSKVALVVRSVFINGAGGVETRGLVAATVGRRRDLVSTIINGRDGFFCKERSRGPAFAANAPP